MYQLYTHNDLDGIGCGIVAKIAFGKEVEIRYNSIGGLDHQVARFLEKNEDKKNKSKMLFITDLSVNEENEKGLNDFAKAGGKVALIDHHKTALHFNQYDWGHVQVEYENNKLTSATSLFYEYLIKQDLINPSTALSEFVELVRQYDTWEWDVNNNVKAKQLNDLFFLSSIEEFEETMLERIKNNPHFEFDEFEVKLLEREEDRIERYVRRKKRELVQTFIGPFCVGIVHAESYHSELGNALGKENDHLDYIAILNLGGKKISFRTIHDNVDVSAVAEEYGGGGHAKAAGCSISNKAFGLFVKEAFSLEPIKQDAFRNQYNIKNMVQGCLFENRKEEQFFIYAQDLNHWVIELNGVEIDSVFHDFKEAEKYIKRNFKAWLARDEHYVDFLKTNYMKQKLFDD